MSTQSQLLIDTGDLSKRGMYIGPDGISTTRIGSVVRFDGVPGNYRFVNRNPDPNASSSWVDISLAEATIEVGIGFPDQGPTSGTWGLSYNGDSTGLTSLAWNITASALQTAINANPTIISDGGAGAVSVQQFGTQYVVIWNVTGPRFTLVSSYGNLSPASVAAVNVTQAGTTSPAVVCIETIQLVQQLYAYTNTSTTTTAGAVTIVETQVGTAGAHEQQRLTWNIAPTGGTYTINLGLAQITDVVFQANTSHALDTLYFLLQDNAGTVAIFMTDSGAIPTATIANRIIVVTIANNDSAATVLGKCSTAITGDAYGWTVTTPTTVTLEITDPNPGVRSLISNGTTSFSVTVKQQGTSYTKNFPWNATAAELSQSFVGYFSFAQSSLGFVLTASTPGPKTVADVDITDLLFPTYYLFTIDLNTYSTFLAFVTQAPTDPIQAVFEIKITLSGGKPNVVYREAIEIWRNVINLNTISPAPFVPGATVGTNYRVTLSGTLQIQSTTTSLWHTLYVVGTPPAEQLAIVTPGVS